MKTCKDCIYHVYLGEDHWEYNNAATNPFTMECRLKPKVRHKRDGEWCGQLKEKVHVISDFENISHNPIGHKVAIPTVCDFGERVILSDEQLKDLSSGSDETT